MLLSPELLLALFVVAAIAGWVDTVAGGGGLLTIPALLLAGAPPAAALATNKLQGSAGTLSATVYFMRRGQINWRRMRLPVATTVVGSAVGAWLVLYLGAAKLVIYLPILLIGIGLYFLLSPHISDEDRQPLLAPMGFALIACPLLGLYDGFFGPGTGSFMCLAFVALAGYNVAKATAHAKLLNFSSNFGSLLYFIVYGDVLWAVGAVMILGQLLGALTASRMVINQGATLVKPVVVTVCFAMSLSLIYPHVF
ncbi:MAG: TSUP family transporter [Granulosicoccaceae bacterium]